MIFDYVFSAPAYLRLMPSKFEQKNQDQYALLAEVVSRGIQKLRKDVERPDEKAHVKIRVLFNAYTETAFDTWLRKWGLFGFENLYADSGGLQVVTTGKIADEKLKSQVYVTQSTSEFAMCFDEIPCENMPVDKKLFFDKTHKVENTYKKRDSGDPNLRDGSLNTKSNRSMTQNKFYFPERAEACARKTAQNIREQIERFAGLNSDTKVFYIIQGNTVDDMVDWFRYGVQELDAWHWDHVGGLALADTCMGNGPQQSVQMLEAYHRIRHTFGEEYVKNHIHLLGVGSVRRLIPLVQMDKGGFLPGKLRVSFDSTTFSMSYVMGRVQMGTHNIDYNDVHPKHRPPPQKNNRVSLTQPKEARQVFEQVFDYFSDLYTTYFPNVSKETFINYLIETRSSVADTINVSENSEDPLIRELSTMVRCNIPLFNAFQILEFSDQLQSTYRDNSIISTLKKQERAAMLELAIVKDLYSYREWESHNHAWMTSGDRSRIPRHTISENSNLITNFWE